MKVSQIASDLNTIFEEIIGTWTDPDGNALLYKEDLSNFIDMGRKIEESTEWGKNFDHYVGKLIDRIGKTIIVDKALSDDGIDIVNDRYEYGALLQKIRIKDIDFTRNEVWDLQAGQDYDYFTFNPVDMEAHYFSDKTTFGAEWSWVGKVLKESLSDLNALTRLYAAIENRIMKKVQICTRAMKKRLINNMNACNILNGRYVNLIEEYRNFTQDTTVDSSNCLNNRAFLEHVVMVMKLYKSFMGEPTTLLNNEGELNWTNKSDFRMILIKDMEAVLTTYLYSDTFNQEFVHLDGYTTVPDWQGNVTDFPFDVRSAICATTTLPHSTSTPSTPVYKTLGIKGIVGCMFDRNGLSIYNEEPEMATAPYNPKGKFINYFYSYDCNYYYDDYEPSVTFVISDYKPVLDDPGADYDPDNYYVLNYQGEYVTITASATAPDTPGDYSDPDKQAGNTDILDYSDVSSWDDVKDQTVIFEPLAS